MRVRAGEVLHEPGRAQHGPLGEEAGQRLVHRAHRRAAAGHGRGAQQDGAAQARRPGQAEERQHDRRRVRLPHRGYEVDAVAADQGLGEGGAVVPVEAHRFRAGERGGSAGGGPDGATGRDQSGDGPAAGGPGGADDQGGDGRGGGHRAPRAARPAFSGMGVTDVSLRDDPDQRSVSFQEDTDRRSGSQTSRSQQPERDARGTEGVPPERQVSPRCGR